MNGKETQPLVSVVMATYNRASFLEACLRSILDQSYRNLECIVVDGASKDNSVEILTRIAAADPRLRFISEPDKGEVYAMNKGIDMAKGEILAFQASDDYYTPGAVEAAVEFLVKNPKYVGVSGDALFVDASGKSLGRGKPTYRGRMAKDTIHKTMIYGQSPWNHGAFFGWRERLLKHGKLDPTFSAASDYEFYFRLLAGGEEIGCLPRIQVHYTLHEGMGAVTFYEKAMAQAQMVHERHNFGGIAMLQRKTIGKLYSYFANPYRPPFVQALVREIKGWFGRYL